MNASESMEARRVVIWVVIFSGVNVLVKGGYALAVLLLASVLSPETFAIFGILYALQGAMTTFSLTGLVETTASRLKTHPTGRRRQVLFQRMSGWFGLTSVLTLLVLGPFVIFVAPSGTFLPAFAAILLGMVIGFGTLQAGFQRLEHQHAASLLASAGIPLFSLVGLCIGGWWSQSLILIFTLGLFGAFIATVLLIITGQTWLGPLPKLKRINNDLVTLSPFVAIGIFGWLSGYGMNFIIDLRFELSQIATFTFLFTVASINQMIVNSLNMVWAPRFYQLFNDNALVVAESRNRYFYSVLALVLGGVGCLTVIFLPWGANLIGGHLTGYGEFRLELAFLMVGYVVAIPFWHGQNYYHVAGYGTDLMHILLWSGGAGLVLWVICMAILGPIGIFVGFTLQMAIKAGAMWIAGNRHWRMRSPWAAITVGCTFVFAGLLFPVPPI